MLVVTFSIAIFVLPPDLFSILRLWIPVFFYDQRNELEITPTVAVK